MNCGEIVSMRGITPATVSHHLKVLNEAGLIECRRQGQFVFSHCVPETVKGYTRTLSKIAGSGKTTRGKKARSPRAPISRRKKATRQR